jgi:gag-polypeptide of LTR copia-type/Integrase core domain/GAG-pre-integrase domain
MASSELGDLKKPKFNGTRSEDFQLWALRVEAIMSIKGVLDGVLPAETGSEGAQGAVADGDESEGEDGQAGRIDGNAAMRRSKAVAIIVSSMGDRPLRAVVGVRGDPREMWRRLHVRYAGASSSTKVSL